MFSRYHRYRFFQKTSTLKKKKKKKNRFFQKTSAAADGDPSGLDSDEEEDVFEDDPDLFAYHNPRIYDIDAVGPNIRLISDDLHQDKGSKGHRMIQGILEGLASPPGQPTSSISVITDGAVRLPSH